MDEEKEFPGSFTTADFIDKIKETLKLSTEIIQNPLSKNEKINNLLKLQCCNALQILTVLNQNELNPRSNEYDFNRPNFADSQKLALLTEINDAIIDKTIHYKDCVKNISEGKHDLIEVQMKLNNNNNSKIVIKDFHQNKGISGLKRKLSKADSPSTPRKVMFLASANVRRPQTVYKFKVDNNYSTPFIPKLTKKPNAIVSLEECCKPILLQAPIEVPNTTDKTTFNYPNYFYPHPYQKEIESFEVSLDFLNVSNEEINKPSSENFEPFKFISTKDQLYALVEILKKYNEISVDVEHHSFRSYQGITCLLQISTDDEDFIIDVFPLWNEMEILNEIFTSPTILKVFHGSDYDIIWLQRDLGIYVVNMFDTGIAAKVLNYSHLSLSYLVHHFCEFTMDKRFQLADWRIRPIPSEMLDYARYDTHFLLYIFRRLKQELLEKSDASANLLRIVMEKSRDMCIKRYEKRLLEPNDHVHLVWKHNLKFNARQMAALKSLYFWRDLVARNEDESTGYVLPNNLLLKICEILPREQQGILACCNPIPPLVRQYINEIHKIILEARSKMVVESTTSVKLNTVKNQDISIDLTNDHLIDHQNKQKENYSENLNHEIVPLLSWSGDKSMFEFVKEHGSNGDSVEEMIVDQTEIKTCQSTNSSICDMFVSNMASFIKKDIQTRQTKNKVDNLFDNYISPFQRYLRTIKKGMQENQESK